MSKGPSGPLSTPGWADCRCRAHFLKDPPVCNRHHWAEVGAHGGEERLQLGWGRVGSTGWPVQRLPRGYGLVG